MSRLLLADQLFVGDHPQLGVVAVDVLSHADVGDAKLFGPFAPIVDCDDEDGSSADLKFARSGSSDDDRVLSRRHKSGHSVAGDGLLVGPWFELDGLGRDAAADDGCAKQRDKPRTHW